MSNWAYIENNEIKQIYSELPANWANISNFFALENDYAYLKKLGWYKIDTVIPTYDIFTHNISSPIYTIGESTVTRTFLIEPKPLIEEPDLETINKENWSQIRIDRDRKMLESDWRYFRYYRQVRLGLIPTDDIEKLDTYMQKLADITKEIDPYKVEWPVLEDKDLK